MRYVELLKFFRDRYNKNRKTKVTKAEIARSLNRSKSHINNIFKDNNQQPPMYEINRQIGEILELSQEEMKRLEATAVAERIAVEDIRYLKSIGVWKYIQKIAGNE